MDAEELIASTRHRPKPWSLKYESLQYDNGLMITMNVIASAGDAKQNKL